jgi:nucleotide-binding universal stress UspA family protein
VSGERPVGGVPYKAGQPGDVVAGLLNDGHAEGVARAAVAEARRRGARLRFVQVVDEGLNAAERAEADQSTFRAAVRALTGSRGIPCRFEVVTGDPTATLIELTRSAAAIVVGEDDEGHLAQTCRERACCPVVTVPFHAA